MVRVSVERRSVSAIRVRKVLGSSEGRRSGSRGTGGLDDIEWDLERWGEGISVVCLVRFEES